MTIYLVPCSIIECVSVIRRENAFIMVQDAEEEIFIVDIIFLEKSPI